MFYNFQFIALFAILAAATAAPQYYQPGHESYQPTHVKNVEYADEPANYEFNYSVHDEHSGDIKQQQESAKDGVISGQYSLIDADGFRRIVDYTADDHHGFNAQVRREPIEGFKAPVVHKVIAQPQYHSASAPAVHKVITAPQYYSAPAPVKYDAPAPQYYSAPAPAVQKVIAQPQYYSAPASQYHSASALGQYATKYTQTPITKNSFEDLSANYHY